MEKKKITFDDVMKIWFDNEVTHVEGRDLYSVALQKGFSGVTEWRLTNALRVGLDKFDWYFEEIQNPAEVLPNVIIGPYKGWSVQKDVQFFDNQLNTTFTQALEIKEFFEFCNNHDRIVPLSENFPLPTTIILVRTVEGKLIHVEGGHRMCAVAYAKKVGKPVNFENRPSVYAAIADINDEQFKHLLGFTKLGTEK